MFVSVWPMVNAWDWIRPGARIAWLGGRNKFWGGTRSLFCVNSRGARGHEKFIPVWIKCTRWGAKIQKDFPAEIGTSSGFSGRKQVISKKKKKKKKEKLFSKIVRDVPAEIGTSSGFSGRKQVISKKKKKSSSPKLQGMFRPKLEIQALFHPKNVMKYGVSPQNTPIWVSICTPVAPSLLIYLGHSPRLGGAQSSLGGGTIFVWGAQAVIWGSTAPVCPPVAPGLDWIPRFCDGRGWLHST